MKRNILLSFIFLVSLTAQAKTFQNSYVSFEVPDNWTCLQEGVAWTCNPSHPTASKEAVIVLAAKVAGPEDNITNFLTFLKEPKKTKTRVGTPMPSQVMYAQQRALGGMPWIQAQHLGSEVQDFYTLYLATVKDQLAILVSFSSEKSRYQNYNPVFDRAIKTLKIVANQKLLIPKGPNGQTESFGIQAGGPGAPGEQQEFIPPPPPSQRKLSTYILVFVLAALILGGVAWFMNGRKQKAKTNPKSAGKTKPK